MKKTFFRRVKLLVKIFLIFILTVILYIACMYGIAYIPVNANVLVCKEDCVEIYLRSNGVHTDIVMPIKDSLQDWTGKINPALTKSKRTDFRYVAIGWGDKGFYLDTPTWGDLTFKTAFNALFYLSSSAMHVTFYDEMKEGEHCKKIYVSKTNYQKIISYIESSFDKNEAGDYVYIENASYGNRDVFLEAKGRYSFLYTCNTWTNNCLKAGDQKACLWTLFDTGIFYQYK